MTNNAAWWITLGLGLVVAIVAIALLQIFLNKVRRVERGAQAIWDSATPVARNTATTWMLTQTTVRLDKLTEEALKHDALLTSVGGSADHASTDEEG
jgi:hypothetical protein